MKKFLNVFQVAEMFNVKPATVRDWSRKGLVNSFKIGREIIISEEEVNRISEAK